MHSKVPDPESNPQPLSFHEGTVLITLPTVSTPHIMGLAEYFITLVVILHGCRIKHLINDPQITLSFKFKH